MKHRTVWHLPTPETFQMEVMYDIDSWLRPHMTVLHEHAHPHCFKFVRGGNFPDGKLLSSIAVVDLKAIDPTIL